MFSYSLLCYSKVTSDFIPLNWIKIVEIQKLVPKQDILLKFGGHFEKKRPLTEIKCSSLVFSYSLLWYSIAPSDNISLNWLKIVEIQKIIPKTRHLLKFGGHFEKSALTALSSTGIFAGNLISIALWLRFPKIVVSKNPPGGAGFWLLAHRLLVNTLCPIIKGFIWWWTISFTI